MATITSAASSTVSATSSSNDWWLKDPLDSAANRAVDVSAKPSIIAKRKGIFRPFSRENAVVVSGDGGARDGSMRLTSMTADEWDDLEALLVRDATLLLQSPLGDQWYVQITDAQEELVNASPEVHAATITYVEVDAP